MTASILAHEAQLRMAAFLAVLGAMALWELAAPRRRLEIPRLIRWTNNIGLVAVDTLIVRLAFPVLAVGVAVLAAENGIGVFNALAVPPWIAVPAAVLLLDLVIYAQHRLFHAVPVLWRLHRVHHADLDFDATTGLRFHPAEIVLSMGVKMVAVAALGAPPVAVVAFEILLSVASIFNHSNVRLPARAERILRRVVVTPDMHRVHHSADATETDSNFGFSVPWWDRLFGSYRAQPRAGHAAMTLGIGQFRTRRDLRLDRMLVQPLRAATADPQPDRPRQDP